MIKCEVPAIGYLVASKVESLCRMYWQEPIGSLRALSARPGVGAYAFNGRLIPAQRPQLGIPVSGAGLESFPSQRSQGRS